MLCVQTLRREPLTRETLTPDGVVALEFMIRKLGIKDILNLEIRTTSSIKSAGGQAGLSHHIYKLRNEVYDIKVSY